MSSTSERPAHVVPDRDADPARGLQPSQEVRPSDADTRQPQAGRTPARRTPEVDEGKELAASRKSGAGNIFQAPLVRAAIGESFRKLDPRRVAKNPVMFVVEIGAAITTIVMLQQIVTGTGDVGFTLQITLWLWFTVVFANFAEAMAEARGKAQADTLRATKKETPARWLRDGREERSRRQSYAKATLFLCGRARSSPAMAKWSRAWRT